MSIRIIASEQNWIESEAVEQLSRTAALPGIFAAVGMPDLHPGNGIPVGAVFASRGIIYPHLVGSDIGCGMSFWQTKLAEGKARPDKMVQRLKGLEGQWCGDLADLLQSTGTASTEFDASLGTIGGGNHFVEIQRIQEIYEPEIVEMAGINPQAISLLVHSGSRGLGQMILRSHVSKHGASGLDAKSEEASSYFSAHDQALNWAKANRKLIAHRFLTALNVEANMIIDICHNFVERITTYGADTFVHRKGAAPSDRGLIVIPGSRGALSYIVAAQGDQRGNMSTVAHGAGRKWKRSECRGRLEGRFNHQNLLKTPLGSKVICDDKSLLYEEAPQAYKDINQVIQDMVEAGMIKVIATLAPLITYKTKSNDVIE